MSKPAAAWASLPRGREGKGGEGNREGLEERVEIEGGEYCVYILGLDSCLFEIRICYL